MLCKVLNLGGVNSKFWGGVYKNFMPISCFPEEKHSCMGFGGGGDRAPAKFANFAKFFKEIFKFLLKIVENRQNFYIAFWKFSHFCRN